MSIDENKSSSQLELGKNSPDAWPFVPIGLAPILGNPLRMAGLTNMNASPLDQIEGLVNAATKILPRMARLADLLPPDTLEFKLNLLSSGCDRVGSNESLCRIQQRTIVLASGEDNLLPSKEEGRRLSRVLPRCQLETLPDASHAALQESNVDLLSILTKAGFDLDPNWTSRRTRHEKNPISIEKPSLREISAARESGVSFIRQLTSPAFFSTLDDGTIVRGLGGVPNEGQSMLLVGNHQTYAFDTGLLIDQFLIEQNRLIRGLAHPVIFRRSANQGNDATTAIGGARGAQGLGGFFTRFGAVEVTGKNFYKLLKNGETVLLFPGGVREAYKRKHEEYQLNWPSAPEFVRMASRHNACIVPFAGMLSIHRQHWTSRLFIIIIPCSTRS